MYQTRFHKDLPISGTNIPITWLLDLSLPAASEEVDGLIALIEQKKHLSAQLLAHLQAHLYESKTRKRVQKFKKALARSEDLTRFLPEFDQFKLDGPAHAPLNQALSELADVLAHFAPQYEKAERIFARDFGQARKKLGQHTGHPKFLEAVYHLSPQFFARLVAYQNKLFGAQRNKKDRSFERTLICYLSRLTTKNTAFGPMGPMAKGQLLADQKCNFQAPVLTDAKSAWNLSRRQVFFSHWAVAAMVAQIRTAVPAHLHAQLRLHPMVIREDGGRLKSLLPEAYPGFPAGEQTLSPAVGAFLERRVPLSKLNADEMAALEPQLRELCQSYFLTDPFEPAYGSFYPLDDLIAAIKTHTNTEAYAAWLHKLQKLCAMAKQCECEAFEEKRGHYEALQSAFESMVGEKAQRGEGAYYADRFIVYEDTLRAPDPFILGQAVHHELTEHVARVLSLEAIDWAFELFPVLFHQHLTLQAIYQASSALAGQKLSFVHLEALTEIFLKPHPGQHLQNVKSHEAALSTLLQLNQLSKQKKALRLQADAASTDQFVQEAQALQRAFFEVLAQSPVRLPIFASAVDFQLGASSLAALKGGQFEVVLDTVIYGNSMNHMLLNYFGTDRDRPDNENSQALRRMLGVNDEMLCTVASVPQQMTKFAPAIGPGFNLELLGRSWREPSGRMGINDLVYAPDSQHGVGMMREEKSQPLYILYPFHQRRTVKRMLDSGEKKQTRIKLGKSVLRRATWQINVADAQFDDWEVKDDFQRFVWGRLVQKRLGLPRWIFADPSGAKKNLGLDFQNPLLMEELAHMLSENETLTLTEMWPTPEAYFYTPVVEPGQRLNQEYMGFWYLDPTS